jgi:hypothetical protein
VSPNTHGVTPMWGFGNVVASSHPKIRTGERVYGYFAPTRYLLLPVSEQDVNDYSFYVPRPHLPAGKWPVAFVGSYLSAIFIEIDGHTIKSGDVPPMPSTTRRQWRRI